MKVRIVKCSIQNDWYSTRTGLEFVVVQSDAWADYYRVLGCEKLILKSDCEIITEEKDMKIGFDPVNRPAHYADSKIETIDFIEDKKLNYHLGNCVKYISRAGKKDPDKTVEDLKKAAWYLNREIERIQKQS